MAKVHPELAPLRELRHSLSEPLLSPFGASSGRNTPSANQFIFGPSVWLRGLIKPGLGRAVAYIDYSSQEVAIAAALSCDPFLIDAVASGDPYTSFAVRAGLAPKVLPRQATVSSATSAKPACGGTNYGMGAKPLAFR